MPHVRTVLVHRLGSQSGSGRRDEPGPGRRGGRPVRGEQARPALKVNITKLSKRTLSKRKREEEKSTEASEPANKTETTVSHRGEKQSAGTDSGGVDVFCFSQRPICKAVNVKEKAKLAVLRTISRMLEENQFIRQRLATANQAK